MEDLSRQIRFTAYANNKIISTKTTKNINNKNRGYYNYYITIKSIKELVYRSHIRGMITMKHGHREFFGYRMTNFLIKYVNNEED